MFDTVLTAVSLTASNEIGFADMQKRKLRIVKPPLPPIGVCESCNSQFKSSKVSQDDAENEIKAAFDSHSCKLATDLKPEVGDCLDPKG
jgi:hypothetical protein